jgi:hypothetical protein
MFMLTTWLWILPWFRLFMATLDASPAVVVVVVAATVPVVVVVVVAVIVVAASPFPSTVLAPAASPASTPAPAVDAVIVGVGWVVGVATAVLPRGILPNPLMKGGGIMTVSLPGAIPPLNI